MIVNVQQTINIRMIKIGAITNSSILQIGTAGVIASASQLYNTGGFTEPAPLAVGDGALSMPEVSLVPL